MYVSFPYTFHFCLQRTVKYVPDTRLKKNKNLCRAPIFFIGTKFAVFYTRMTLDDIGVTDNILNTASVAKCVPKVVWIAPNGITITNRSKSP